MEQHTDFILDIWEKLINEEIDFEEFVEYAREYVEDNYLG